MAFHRTELLRGSWRRSSSSWLSGRLRMEAELNDYLDTLMYLWRIQQSMSASGWTCVSVRKEREKSRRGKKRWVLTSTWLNALQQRGGMRSNVLVIFTLFFHLFNISHLRNGNKHSYKLMYFFFDVNNSDLKTTLNLVFFFFFCIESKTSYTLQES